jgi:hypothetical protein
MEEAKNLWGFRAVKKKKKKKKNLLHQEWGVR